VRGGRAAALAATLLLIAAGPAQVDNARLLNANREPGEWMSTGRTWDEQHFSPLTQINDKNVGRLGLLWYDDLNTYRGVEATPLVVDGILYNVSACRSRRPMTAPPARFCGPTIPRCRPSTRAWPAAAPSAAAWSPGTERSSLARSTAA
jgi:quinohemoprotein ethanol dehydrogenase